MGRFFRAVTPGLQQPSPGGVRLPDHLPRLFGAITAILVTAWVLAQVVAEASLGRPSSTAGLGFVFGPIYGLVCGGVSFMTGLGIRWLARRAGMPSRRMPSWFLAGVVVAMTASLAMMVVTARSQVLALEAARQPRVIVESARLVKTADAPGRELMRIEAPLFFSLVPATVTPSIEWNGHLVTFEASDERVIVLNAAGQQVATTDLHAFDYIGRIHAVPVCTDSTGNQALAVLVTLRPTSHRSMLILYAADGTVVYQEHLERTGVSDTPMYGATRNGLDVLVVDHGAMSAWTCAG